MIERKGWAGVDRIGERKIGKESFCETEVEERPDREKQKANGKPANQTARRGVNICYCTALISFKDCGGD